MEARRIRFSFTTQLYFWVITASIVLLPLEFEAIRVQSTKVASQSWWIALAIEVVIMAALLYANKRCRAESMSYVEGLQFSTSFMREAGLLYVTLLFVFASLAVLIPVSIVISLYGDLTGSSTLTPRRYHALVSLLHRHRMHQ